MTIQKNRRSTIRGSRPSRVSQVGQSPEVRSDTLPFVKRSMTTIKDMQMNKGAQDKLQHLHKYTIIDSMPLPGINMITKKSVMTLFGGFILLILSGLALCVGAVIPYIVSLYRYHLRYDVNYDTFQPL